MVATAPRHSRSAVPIHEPATRDVDDRYELFVFLRHDDPLTVLAEERIVGRAQCLPAAHVARPRELPHDSAARIDHDEPVVATIGDQYRARQQARMQDAANDVRRGR